jgi:hypothetical protein
MKLNGTHQLPFCAYSVNIMGEENINIIEKSTEALRSQ